MDKIDQILNRIVKLPPAPQLLPRLLHTLTQIDTDLGQIVDIISFDPALTAKLLQVCNSAVFRGTSRVSDVSEAVNRLGLQAVYRIVAAVVGEKSFKLPGAADVADTGELWRHSVIAAFAAQFLSEDLTPDNGLLFTAGLLHEIGHAILADVFKKKPVRPVADGVVNLQILIDQEKRNYGVDHAELGARLLERWNFSPVLVDCVRFHHHPADAGEHATLAACVNLGDAVAYGLEQETRGQTITWLDPGSALGILRLTTEDLPRYLGRIKENLEFVEAMCRVQG